MERVFWRATIREGKKEEYVRRHDEIWPEMQTALKEAGIENYTIWADGNDLYGYYECGMGRDFALEFQAKNPVVLRWEKSMEPLMEKKDFPVREIFRLE